MKYVFIIIKAVLASLAAILFAIVIISIIEMSTDLSEAFLQNITFGFPLLVFIIVFVHGLIKEVRKMSSDQSQSIPEAILEEKKIGTNKMFTFKWIIINYCLLCMLNTLFIIGFWGMDGGNGFNVFFKFFPRSLFTVLLTALFLEVLFYLPSTINLIIVSLFKRKAK